MAGHAKVEYATAEGNDYPAHRQMYATFLTLTKWGIGFVVVLLLLMYYFLV